MASRDRGPGGRGPPGLDSSRRSHNDPASRRARANREASRPRRPEDPPARDPARYSQTDHFRERLLQQGRYVSVTDVSEAIRRGQLRWNTSDGWRFALRRDGVRVVVVVEDTETASPVVVTAWTELADRATALDSDRWHPEDVETIQVRGALSERPDEQVPEEIRPREIAHPFEVGDHHLVTDPGSGHLDCVDCGGRFRSKNDLVRRYCQR